MKIDEYTESGALYLDSQRGTLLCSRLLGKQVGKCETADSNNNSFPEKNLKKRIKRCLKN